VAKEMHEKIEALGPSPISVVFQNRKAAW
jgi:hypothetical protein